MKRTIFRDRQGDSIPLAAVEGDDLSAIEQKLDLHGKRENDRYAVIVMSRTHYIFFSERIISGLRELNDDVDLAEVLLLPDPQLQPACA